MTNIDIGYSVRPLILLLVIAWTGLLESVKLG